MFQVLSPKLLMTYFKSESKYLDLPELRQRSQFPIAWIHSVFSGTESLKFLGPKVWALVPDEMKQLETLGKFRNAIKQWKPISCSCRLCKRCIHRIGLL